MDLIIRRKNAFREPDPRIKLLMAIILPTMTFMSDGIYTLAFSYALMIMLYLCCTKLSSTIKTGCVLCALLMLGILIKGLSSETLQTNLGLIVFMLQRCAGFVVMAGWMSQRLRIGDFTTAMQKMHLPKGIAITFAVIFRYFPTVSEEFRLIKNTMKLRGVAPNLKNILRHPIKTCEYALVPLIMRAMRVADELSASAMTRGLDLESHRSSYREVKLCLGDYIFAVLFIALSIGGTLVLKEVS